MKRLPPYFFKSIIVWMIFFLPGCSRYSCWFLDVFNQGRRERVDDCLTNRFVRSIRVYDQVDTLGLFSALWLHDEVREAYVEAYAVLHCLDDRRAQQMLHQEFAETRHTIAFYLLASTRHNFLLTDKNSEWHVQLLINGECINPVNIKTIHLSPEYIRLFGPWFNRFKQQYLLKFNAVAADGTRLIGPSTRKIELIFNRLGQSERMTWCLDSSGSSRAPTSFNRNILAYDIDNNF